MLGRPRSLASEQRLMIFPRRRVFMPGITARATKNGPSRLVAINERHCSSPKVSSGARWFTAALLTRMSIARSRSSEAMAAATASDRVTSNGATSTRIPSRSSAAAAASRRARLRPLMVTSAPASARPRAIARPRPEPPPVTSARRPVSSKGWRMARSLSPQPQHVLHVEQAGRAGRSLVGDEPRRSQRSLREVEPRAGLVRQLPPLAGAREDDAVIADYIAAAQARETDGTALALARHAMAAEHAIGSQVASQAFRRGFAQQQRRAGWGVDLVPVMHLDDLHVVGIAHELRRLLDQPREHRHPHAHVRREHDRDRAPGLRQRALVLRGEAGGR